MPSLLLLAVLTLGAAGPPAAAAQERTAPGSRPGWSLTQTMREFTRALGGSAPGFFPSQGDWTWVQTRDYPDGRTRRTPWRFPAAQTALAMHAGGPVCPSFASGDAVRVGTLVWRGMENPGRWRRVGATRFVPPGEPAGSPYWVEWRREDGRWVVAAYGEEGRYVPKLAANNPPAGAPRLRLPLPADAPVAADATWFRNNEPVVLQGTRLVRYGLPRQLTDGDLVLAGAFQGVSLYADRRARGVPRIVYVPVDRAGTFQSYQNEVGTGCES